MTNFLKKRHFVGFIVVLFAFFSIAMVFPEIVRGEILIADDTYDSYINTEELNQAAIPETITEVVETPNSGDLCDPKGNKLDLQKTNFPFKLALPCTVVKQIQTNTKIPSVDTRPSFNAVTNSATDTWNQVLNVSGDVYDIKISPSNPNIIYASNIGSIYKSTDAGSTWAKTNLNSTNGYIYSIAINPTNPSIVYAGGSDNVNNVYQGAVWKSIDAGSTWTKTIIVASTTFNDLYGNILFLAVNPSNPNIIYAEGNDNGHNASFWKSTDAGATWTKTIIASSSVGISSVTINPTNPNIFYATGSDAYYPDYGSNYIFKSIDAGATWTKTVFGSGYSKFIRSIVISPTNPNIFYGDGRYYDSISGWVNAVWKSTDGGTTWGNTSQGYYFLGITSIAINPTNPNIIYVGGIDFGSVANTYKATVWKSTDAGATWGKTTLPATGSIFSLAINPTNPDIVFVGTSDGIWKNTPTTSPCTVDCNSSVMFLPGIMGSRLYEQAGNIDCGVILTGKDCLQDDELWVSRSDDKHSKLELDANGKDKNNLYTINDTQRLDGEIDEKGIVDDVYTSNIYESFVNNLRDWKLKDKIIADYAFIPYDWRLSLDDIITNGKTTLDHLSYKTPQNFSESFILKKLEELQKTSKSGNVTIIGHSNGGLVVKALVQKLKDTNNPLYDKIDKVILIAVPQVGTPDGMAALLHGTSVGPGGFIMSPERSRQLAENMSTMYNFLPSAGYFTTVDPVFAVDKLASFQNTAFFNAQTSKYGIYISNQKELKDYVLGTDGRTRPTFSDTVHPNIGNSTLYSQAENIHQILDNWTPASNTKVIQVAGWGEETLAGLDYTELVEPLCPNPNSGCVYGSKVSYKFRTVVDGDGTVVVPSALWMSITNPNVERWWVDLKSYNKSVLINSLRTQHRDILEVPILRDFIKSKIKDESLIDLDHIIVDNTSTLKSDGVRLHYTLHSPLTLGITDAQGRYTGMDPITKQIKQEIPNVTYKQIGEVQFISVPAGTAYTLKMKGYETGSFSLDVDKQTGNTVSDNTSFQAIPSNVSTVVTMDIPTDFNVATSALKLDNNGDGIIDQTLIAPRAVTGVGRDFTTRILPSSRLIKDRADATNERRDFTNRIQPSLRR